MKSVIDPKDHESVLAEWRGTQAKVWAFHVSHSRMAISLTRPGEGETLYVVGIACERFSGPLRWAHADISVTKEPPNQWGEVLCRLTDKQAGFELLCSDVAVVRGLATVPNDPFDNFFGSPPQGDRKGK